MADGYSGNILLKTVEGAAKLLLGEMKKAFLSSTKSKLGALLVKDSLGDVKKLLDPSEVGRNALPWHQQACAEGPRLL